jgi:hypothetical protein
MKLGPQNIKMQELPRGFAPLTTYQGAALLLSHEIGSPKRQNAEPPGGFVPWTPLVPGRCPAHAGDLAYFTLP